jgi:hypothetical protein
MTTAAKNTQGVEFQIETAVPGTFVLISEVTNFQAPGLNASEIEVTSLDSEYVERIGGIKDGDQATMDFNFLYADPGQARLRALVGTTANFRIELNDAATPTRIAFAAVITAVPGVSGGVNEAQKVSGATVRVTGAPVITPGTP